MCRYEEMDWDKLCIELSEKFNAELDLQGILFLIGVQEVGKGYRKFSKDEKLEVIHVAVCTVLIPLGYYAYTGKDTDGWPQFELIQELPLLKAKEQESMMKYAVLKYFNKIGEKPD
jgi:hypothetical protein